MGESAVEAIEATEPVKATASERMDLTEMAAAASQEAIAAGNLSSVMETAMSGIVEMPGAGVDAVALKEDLAGGTGGDVTREKGEMLSDPAAEGGSSTTENGQNALMARYEKLYAEMTVFQVAWSIARRVQQDTAQLLRGQ